MPGDPPESFPIPAVPDPAPPPCASFPASMAETIRIANAGGYWGDDLTQFKRQVELGRVDYVTLDFLAEITMSIMQKQRARDPRAGYARDFVAQVRETLPLLLERGTKVISNGLSSPQRAVRRAFSSCSISGRWRWPFKP